MATIDSLPAEMLLKIIGSTVSATPRRPADRLKSQTLQYNLCLVSRRFCALTTPLLYRHVVLSRYLDKKANEAIADRTGVYDPEHDFCTDRLVLFLRTLLASPRHRDMVQNLDLRIYLTELNSFGDLELWRPQGAILSPRVYPHNPQALINDYKGILRSWATHSSKISSPALPYDSHAQLVIHRVGLHWSRVTPEPWKSDTTPYPTPPGFAFKAQTFDERLHGKELVRQLSPREHRHAACRARVFCPKRLSILSIPGDIGQRIFAAILCLTPNLRVITIRSPPSPNHLALNPRTSYQESYAIASFLVSQALSDPVLGPTVLPKLETYRVALGIGEVFRMDPTLKKLGSRPGGNPFQPDFAVLPHICPGILEAPKVSTVDIAYDMRTGSAWAWGPLTACSTNITRVTFYSQAHWDIETVLLHVCNAWKLKELVCDAPVPDPLPRVNPRAVDSALLQVKDTLEVLDFALGVQRNPRGDSTPMKLECLPKMRRLKHLHVSPVLLFGRLPSGFPSLQSPPLSLAEVLPPHLVTLRLAVKSFVRDRQD
ncbi:hypothetical protein B0T19DRAFT_467029 [Cercophora scortea]|uniref:Uncharacterized protein n=1 Tax=Cercophora scortea TaxID=314031 RepID=A0AAE0M6A8_9PEZI|nr:hypothetical protein B0T19DRAFT_467029 [Cercophora scortea]